VPSNLAKPHCDLPHFSDVTKRRKKIRATPPYGGALEAHAGVEQVSSIRANTYTKAALQRFKLKFEVRAQ
jgi:hypothetical protein